jgi:HK97 family phage portal protein
MVQPTKTPIDQGILARAIAGVKYALTGKNDWMGPGEPIQPVAPQNENMKGRQYDYPVAINSRWNTKNEDGGIPHQTCRAFADSYDLLRLVIETRKDQMSKLRWNFVNKDPDQTVPSPNIEKLKKFFEYPDQEHDWDTWLRALIEDMLVVDAATIYPRRTVGGELYALELVDGTTIKRVLDITGRTPAPPEVAYQQIIKGVIASDYNRDELIYRPRNVRTHKAYGFSVVQQVIMTVNIAIRRQVSQLQYYTEGNIPEALIGVPEDWTPDQIERFQTYWDSLVEGQQEMKRKAKFVPGKMAPTFTKSDLIKDAMDEWLARIICFAFNISPQSLVAQMNRATAETAQAQALQEGLAPNMKWVKNLIDYAVVKYFGFDDVEFEWEEEDETSSKDQCDILTKYVQQKIMTDDEARDKLGMEPLTDEQREALKPPPMTGLLPDGTPDPDAQVPGEENVDEDSKKKPGEVEAKQGEKKEEPPAKKSVSFTLQKSKKLIIRNRPAVVNATTDLSRLIAPALQKASERIANEAVGTLGKAGKTFAGKITLPELVAIQPELAEYFEDIFADGGQIAVAQVTLSQTQLQVNRMLEQVNEKAVVYAKERAAELVTQITDSTRNMIQSSLATALEEGLTNDELANMLRDAYAFSDERSLMIARTELAFADIQGNLEGYKASGVVKGKQWSASQSDYCEICEELDGVIVGLDEDFPGGVDAPPVHPNCACDILPVLDED